MTRPLIGSVRILCLLLLSSVATWASEIVFENMTGVTTNYYMFGRQYGDDINLTGSGRVVTQFSFLYYGNVPTNLVSPGEWRIRFYKNDGALENPAVATSQKPNTLLWDSGTYPVLPGYRKTTLEVPRITVPDRFTWTVEFYNLPQDSSAGAGLVLANPPTIGAVLPGKSSTVIGSYTDFWMLEEADIPDSWTLQIFSTNPNVGPQGNFFAQVVTAANPNQAPVWTTKPTTRRVTEGNTLLVQLKATDADLPPQPLTYRLISGPTGLTLSTNGVLSWRPTEEQGPSTNRVRVEVADGIEGASQEFDIVVQEQNVPPVWNTIGTRRVAKGQTLSLQLGASDTDRPAQPLTYRLVSGPAGLTVTTNGMLSWTPSLQQGSGTNRVRVAVDDTFITVTQDFDLVVEDAPAKIEARLAIVPGTGRGLSIHLRGTAGGAFRIEQNTRPGGDGWIPVSGLGPVTGKGLADPVVLALPEDASATRFYRAGKP